MLNIRDKKAQTALELAVFGAILIFVLGTIVRSSVNRSNQQQAYLKATRMALTMSHKTTERKKVSGRNMATVLIVEDRITVASAKYGARDRSPFMTQGSGIHSANLLMPVDFGNLEDLPVFDMFINGQHFVFTSAGFKSVQLAIPCSSGNCNIPGCTVVDGECHGVLPGSYATDHNKCEGYWEPDCISSKIIITEVLPCANASPCPPLSPPAASGSCPNGCGPMVIDTYENSTPGGGYTVGCAKLYTVIDNHPLIKDWCDGDLVSCDMPDPRNPSNPDRVIPPCYDGPPDSYKEGCNLSADERFNLDRWDAVYPDGLDCLQDDRLDCLSGSVTVPPLEREKFSWQWFMVMGVDHNKLTAKRAWNSFASSLGSGRFGPVSISLPGLKLAEGIVLPGGEAKPMNTALDVDCDLTLEYIMPNVEKHGDHPGVTPNKVGKDGVILQIGVQDPNEGDVDFTYNSSNKLLGIEQFGFTRNVTLYSFIRDKPGSSENETGTYFQIDEGKLYTTDPDRQFIRTASKKDQVDLIERVWRLSNNTGRYCGANGDLTTPTVWKKVNTFIDANGNTHDDITAGERMMRLVNPVETCQSNGKCYDDAYNELTCMDTDNNIILIRSRIKDLHGRKWVTYTGDDPYVDFTTPPVP